MSVIQFTPPKRRGTDQTVLSCLAWSCKLALRDAKAIFVSANKYTAHDFVPTMLAYPVRRLTQHPRTSVTAQACAFCAWFSFFSLYHIKRLAALTSRCDKCYTSGCIDTQPGTILASHTHTHTMLTAYTQLHDLPDVTSNKCRPPTTNTPIHVSWLYTRLMNTASIVAPEVLHVLILKTAVYP